MNGTPSNIIVELTQLDLDQDIDFIVCEFSSDVLRRHGLEGFRILCEYALSSESPAEQEKCCHALRGMAHCSNGLPLDLLQEFSNRFVVSARENPLHAIAIANAGLALSNRQVFFKSDDYYTLLRKLATHVASSELPGWMGTNVRMDARHALEWIDARNDAYAAFESGRAVIGDTRLAAVLTRPENRFRSIGFSLDKMAHARECAIRQATERLRQIGDNVFRSSFPVPSLLDFTYHDLAVDWERGQERPLTFVDAHVGSIA